MRIIYSRHAIDKLKTKGSKKFKITKNKLKQVIKKPITEQSLPFGVIRAVGTLSDTRSLCVIYKFEENKLKIITFFPAEKGRYENKILS